MHRFKYFVCHIGIKIYFKAVCNDRYKKEQRMCAVDTSTFAFIMPMIVSIHEQCGSFSSFKTRLSAQAREAPLASISSLEDPYLNLGLTARNTT